MWSHLDEIQYSLAMSKKRLHHIRYLIFIILVVVDRLLYVSISYRTLLACLYSLHLQIFSTIVFIILLRFADALWTDQTCSSYFAKLHSSLLPCFLQNHSRSAMLRHGKVCVAFCGVFSLARLNQQL